MSENELEILKKLFSNSTENVFILNYDLETVWHNKDELLEFFKGKTFRELLNCESGRLKSGEYTLMYSGLEFFCTIIDYKEMQLYILQLEGSDVLSSCMKSETLKGFFANQAARVRHAVTGVSIAENMIRRIAGNAGLEDVEEYLDITSGSCYRLLKSVLNTTELMKYTEEANTPRKINLTETLEEFEEICKKILNGRLEIKTCASPELFVRADYERLTSCLLSLALIAGKQKTGCQTINIKAERVGESVFINASASGGNERKMRRMFSESEILPESDISNSDLFVVYRFCRTFGGTLFAADETDSDGKIYSVKLPYCSDDDEALFRSSASVYHDDRFSKYHIALSDIADIY